MEFASALFRLFTRNERGMIAGENKLVGLIDDPSLAQLASILVTDDSAQNSRSSTSDINKLTEPHFDTWDQQLPVGVQVLLLKS